MVVMALDHARDFLHAPAMIGSPEDLARTTPAIFLTRWVTHFVAPAFALVAGLAIYCRSRVPALAPRLPRYLVTRGLWLVLLEITVMRFAMNFTLGGSYPVLLLVLTSLGGSMIAMAAIIRLPLPAILTGSALVLGLHNLLGPISAGDFGAWAAVWRVLVEPGVFVLFGQPVVVGYPIVPWLALMAGGFALGPVLDVEPERRRRLLVLTGVSMIAGFLLLRGLNLYGDPSPWSTQPTAVGTALAFLRTTKYPPSLQFVLMTAGPVLLALAWLDGRRLSGSHPLAAFGRAPLVFYVAHFALLHAGAWLLSWVQYGTPAFGFLAMPFPSMGGPGKAFPAGFGHSLPVVYAGWALTVAVLYPVCLRIAGRGAAVAARAGANPGGAGRP
jgi:uncharacterized membrane protein